jgi:hypothetical protein
MFFVYWILRLFDKTNSSTNMVILDIGQDFLSRQTVQHGLEPTHSGLKRQFLGNITILNTFPPQEQSQVPYQRAF